MQNINTVFGLQRAHSISLRNTDAGERKDKLRKLKSLIQENEELIFEALQKDLRKSEFEAALTEVYFVYAEIDFAIKNLSAWLKPRRVGAAISGLFTKNRIIYEPKGVSLIIAPWNYPFQLLISPLVSAIAAGNCAMLKPSELSPATGALLSKLINENFDPKEIACFEGGIDTSEALLELPFDHIFFTGSSKVGKIVMSAAARHLSSLTLELGGKSPVVITRDADLEKAAEKIVWGKFMNSGQTCIAPDYVLIDADQEQEFLRLASLKIEQLFCQNKILDKSSYGRIINLNHYRRLKAISDEAVKDGAIAIGAGTDSEEDLTIAPVLLSSVSESSVIMQEEIFGPLLPVITFQTLDQAIDLINRKPKPLALYIFSGSDTTVRKIIRQTSAGGTCVNDVILHISNPNLPFGGIGNSGSGSYHGFFGFKAFSHERAVMFQSKVDFGKIVYPPYQTKKVWLKWIKKIM